jgi:hypothetical protein
VRPFGITPNRKYRGSNSQIRIAHAEEGASIVDVAHDRAFASEDLTTVTVHCILETRDPKHIASLRRRLRREGFQLRSPWRER